MGRSLEYCRGRQSMVVGGRGSRAQFLVNPDYAQAVGSDGLRRRGFWGATAQVRVGFSVSPR